SVLLLRNIRKPEKPSDTLPGPGIEPEAPCAVALAFTRPTRQSSVNMYVSLNVVLSSYGLNLGYVAVALLFFVPLGSLKKYVSPQNKPRARLPKALIDLLARDHLGDPFIEFKSLTANRKLLKANPPLTSVTGDHHGIQCVKENIYSN
ncbi:hypothetical protein SFRURICE_016770, partial [Spodoptera frugiperda]